MVQGSELRPVVVQGREAGNLVSVEHMGEKDGLRERELKLKIGDGLGGRMREKVEPRMYPGFFWHLYLDEKEACLRGGALEEHHI